MEIPLGQVTHYFDRLGVAIVALDAPLSVGDKIKIIGHGKEFTQDVVSIQKEHQPVEGADKGETVGIKVDQPVKEKDKVFKIS